MKKSLFNKKLVNRFISIVDSKSFNGISIVKSKSYEDALNSIENSISILKAIIVIKNMQGVDT